MTRRRLLRALQVFDFLVALSAAAAANPLPAPEALTKQPGVQPVTLTVIEPHESRPGAPVEIAYRAFPAASVLSAALGPDWAKKAKAIAFQALDGYVSRIDVDRLQSGKAYMAFARADGAPFTVDNIEQNQRNVPLGPYYLIWDNRADPNWAAKGAAGWPYQVASVTFAASESVLRPPGFDPALEPGLVLAEAQCLTCHSVNGYGGAKSPGDLAVAARSLPRSEFLNWVIAPRKADPAATMPPLSPNLPEDQRQANARAIYDYLSRVPAAPLRP